MAITALNNIKNWFKTGLKPTQNQFWDTWDSFWHKGESIPVASIEGIDDLLQSKASTTHLNDPNAHSDLFENKLDKDGYQGTAQTLSDKIDAIKYPDALLNSVPPTMVGNQVTFLASMYLARINQNQLFNLAYSTTIAVATANYHRTDLFELWEDGTIHKVVGAESLTEAFKPNLSANAVEITTVDVFGTVIGNPSTPYDTSSLLPRGGYNGTAQDLANGMVDLNAANLKLGGYPSTRNDGQLPMNKVLGTDASGNLKMYTIATAPAPYMEVLIPDSTLPSTTTNFTIKGAFFTPTMTVTIVGQTINYITFVSDNLIKVNVTTSPIEGMYDVTLNNGLIKTYNNALLIVLGTVYTPIQSEWINLLSTPDITSNGRISNLNSATIQGADWKIIPAGQNFRIMMTAQRSAFSSSYDPIGFKGNLQLVGVSDGLIKLWSAFRCWAPGYSNGGNARTWMISTNEDSGDGVNTIAYGDPYQKTITIERIGTTIKHYVNSELIKTFIGTIDEDVIIRFKIIDQDISNIKYIKIA